jgi:Cu-processing system permease protein
MIQIYAVGVNTFREAIRNRIFASLVMFAIAMLLLTLAVSSASLHEEVRLMKDLGLFLVSTFSVLIAIFIGVNLLYKEIERKTIYTIMPKPIHRAQFLLGKFAGLAWVMAVQVGVMGLVLALQFWLLDARFGVEMVQAVWLAYMEVVVMVAVALLFSSFSTPFLSGLLTFGVFAVGRIVDRLATLKLGDPSERTETHEQISMVIRGVAKVWPDLSLYNVTPNVVHGAPVTWGFVGSATLYGLTYAAVVLLFACVVFQRRDFI